MPVKSVSPVVLPVRSSDPGSSVTADIYYNSSTKKVRVRGSGGWFDASTGSATSTSAGDVGTVLLYAAGVTAPTGWLFCDGTAVSRSTYSGLYALIGTSYGAGNGTTTFNLPDFSDRILFSAPSSFLVSDIPSNTATWFTGSVSPYSTPFSHSAAGDHDKHGETQGPVAGDHSHTDSHSHTASSGSGASVTMGSHTASGAFGFGGAAHTHTRTSGATSAPTATLAQNTPAITVASGVHTHVVTLASAGASTNHVAGSTSYAKSVTHSGHSHTAGSGSSSTDDIASTTTLGHNHSINQGASGNHQHTDHDLKIYGLTYIIKT